MERRGVDSTQKLQEEQYQFPYHYIPELRSTGEFSHTRYWSWGYRYLGGFEVVLKELHSQTFSSLIDIGCGDGRFLRVASKNFPDCRLLGIDYSTRAIALARAMNPTLSFEQGEISKNPLEPRFEAATLIEVLEHIPPPEVPRFLAGIRSSLAEDAVLVATVPHRNQQVSPKHYQHFDSPSLSTILEPHFQVNRFIPFDARSRWFAVLRRIFAGKGDHFVITNERLLGWFFRLYRKRFLYASHERHCSRLGVVCIAR